MAHRAIHSEGVRFAIWRFRHDRYCSRHETAIRRARRAPTDGNAATASNLHALLFGRALIVVEHGLSRNFTNYTLTILGILCDFAREKEWMNSNPVQSVRRLPRHSDAPRANRPWRPEECRIVLEAAPAYLRVPIALAMLAGFRRADVVTVAKTAIRDGVIEVRTQKRGRFVRVPIHPELARALAGAPEHRATTIAANSTRRRGR